MSCHNPNSKEFKEKLKTQPNPILASIELDMEANTLSDDLSLENYYMAHKSLYEEGTYDEYMEYRKNSNLEIGSKEDVALFKKFIEQRDWDSHNDFNIKCI
jgi:hypothetical protein